jgi:para-nitrobenzyl esterase
MSDRTARDVVKRTWLIAGAVVLALAGTGAATRAAAPADTGCSTGTTVQTGDGPVCGSTGDGYARWQGIPYAAAPIGSLRWQPPQPHAPWSSVLQATSSGSACPQTRGPTISADEDCLALDVVAPAGAANLPVLVWIYGGAFNEGADSLYDGIKLATEGHLLFVAMNYRVGVLGFLADGALGEHSGNYGLEDQQAALAWVQRNVAAFGGNPAEVTIAGQSAGGSSVCDQIASPTARGLFRYAISESGEYNSIGTDPAHQPQDCKTTLPAETQASAAGAQFAADVGCATASDVAACLRALPVSAVLAAQKAGYGTQAPIIDGTTLTRQAQQSFASGKVNGAAVLIGVGRDEDLQGAPTTAAEVAADVQARYGASADAVLREYPLDRYASPFVAYRTLVADSDTVCPALEADRKLSEHVRVYAYENDDTGAALLTGGGSSSLPNGVYHAAELPFLFPDYPGSPSPDPDQQVLADQVVAEWTAFVRTGEPRAAGTPAWPSFGRGSTVMSLQEAGDSQLVSAAQIAQDHNCEFWETFR